MTDPAKNATHLFELPKRQHRSSESFWSSLFALWILGESASGQSLKLPTFRFMRNGDDDWWFDPGDPGDPPRPLIIPAGLCFQDIVVEGKIMPGFLDGLTEDIPDDLFALSPDVLIYAEKRIIIVEVKTLGYHLGPDQIRNYRHLADYLTKNGFSTELYFLLSAGHEVESDWDLLEAPRDQEGFTFRILLWEQVLKKMREDSSASFARKCLGDVRKFYIHEDAYLRSRPPET